jgi:hypothetical protein
MYDLYIAGGFEENDYPAICNVIQKESMLYNMNDSTTLSGGVQNTNCRSFNLGIVIYTANNKW